MIFREWDLQEEKDLMRSFENIEAIRNATVDDLKELPSMNEKSAQEVYKFFTRILKYGIIGLSDF